LSFAKLLLSRGCNVVIADIALRPEAQTVIDEHSSTDGSKARAVFVKTDGVNGDDLTNMFDVAEKEFGGVDIVRTHPCLSESFS
jgi:NAD(P)-dependent dehydrogenase (short-subunit alcohol dehydrogenase family)